MVPQEKESVNTGVPREPKPELPRVLITQRPHCLHCLQLELPRSVGGILTLGELKVEFPRLFMASLAS